MKKIVLFSLMTWALSVNGQTPITLNRTDFPCPIAAAACPTDSVLYTNVPIASNSVDLTVNGTNAVWNHAGLTTTNTNFQRFVPVSNAPLAFQLFFIGSDFANPLLGNTSLAGLPVSDAYEFYNYASSNSRLEIRGYGANITIPGQTTAIPLPAIYSSPDVLYKFPVTFGDIDSSTSGYSVTIPPTGTALATVKRSQKRLNEVDAWGSVTTPAGTFDVLRIKSTINRVDSIITGIFPLGVPTTTIEYKWFAKGKKIPVLQVNETVVGGNGNTTSITYWGSNPLSTSDAINSGTQSFGIYPNPANDFVIIQFEDLQKGDLKLELFSLTGNKIADFQFLIKNNGLFSEKIPVNGLPAGHYVMKCLQNGKTNTQKLILQ